MSPDTAVFPQAHPSCLLCQIVTGDAHADKILETENIIAVMNTLEPFSRGHCVFFPKRHVSKLHQAEDRDLAEILQLVKRRISYSFPAGRGNGRA